MREQGETGTGPSWAMLGLLSVVILLFALACFRDLVNQARAGTPHACWIVVSGGLILLALGWWGRRQALRECKQESASSARLSDEETGKRELATTISRKHREQALSDLTWSKVVTAVGAVVAVYGVVALLWGSRQP
ncbi:MAG TPA: hypothetical protein VM221_09295 [Armatimonadota bacterium]|nr:hypothetical protein [Armatimonadota bacterium]